MFTLQTENFILHKISWVWNCKFHVWDCNLTNILINLTIKSLCSWVLISLSEESCRSPKITLLSNSLLEISLINYAYLESYPSIQGSLEYEKIEQGVPCSIFQFGGMISMKSSCCIRITPQNFLELLWIFRSYFFNPMSKSLCFSFHIL